HRPRQSGRLPHLRRGRPLHTKEDLTQHYFTRSALHSPASLRGSSRPVFYNNITGDDLARLQSGYRFCNRLVTRARLTFLPRNRHSCGTVIEMQGVGKTYQTPAGAFEALRGVDLEVARGEIFGIIGRSGAGKSTLLRTINLLERPTTGRVLVEGTDVT